ncbi:MAG: hypothetical protein RBS07_16510 [Lentimicrobium sp.]|jgi:hypothetical protein|nr:hypothetical protein [Lentimicrobium sp.]
MSKILKFPASNMPQALNPDEVYKNLFEADRAGKYKKILGNTLNVFIENIKKSNADFRILNAAYELLKVDNEIADKKRNAEHKHEGKLMKLTFK